MEDVYAHLQKGSVQSVSGMVNDTYEQIELSVQPEEKRQMQSPTTTTGKVILGLIGGVVLVALVVAVVAVVRNQQHNSGLNEKMSSLEQMVHKLQADLNKLTGSELPLTTSTGTSYSTSPAPPAPTSSTPATPVLTTSTPTTPVQTAPTPATPALTAATPTTPVLTILTPTTPVPTAFTPATHIPKATTATTLVRTAPTPATPVLTAATPTTPVPTAPTPATPLATASSQSTTVSSTDTSLTSCAAIHSSHPSAPSGVYTIHIGGRVQGREVFCDMVTNGGGWTRFQRRQDGSVSFNRNWSEYKSGFGSAAAEIWFGNDDIHTLTSAQPSELRVDLWDWEGNHTYATYSNFSLSSESTNYKLHVSGYDGTAGDSLWYQNNRPFSTFDRDNDIHTSGNCAVILGGGGWWFAFCAQSNLNGRYFQGGVITIRGVYWYFWQNNQYSYKAASMMTRPRQ